MSSLSSGEEVSSRGNQDVEIIGGTDGTAIGNVGSRFAVDTLPSQSAQYAPMIYRTDVASSARTTSSDSGWLDSAGLTSISFTAGVTAVSGTTPKLDIELQFSDDQTNSSIIRDTQRFTATGVQRFEGIRITARYYRYVWTIAGTTPSFTFSIITTLKITSTARNVGMNRYSDIDLTTQGNFSTVFTAGSCPNVTVQLIRGADGGNGSAVHIQGSGDNVNFDDLTGNISMPVSSSAIQSFTGLAIRYYRVIVQTATNAGTRTLDLIWSGNDG